MEQADEPQTVVAAAPEPAVVPPGGYVAATMSDAAPTAAPATAFTRTGHTAPTSARAAPAMVAATEVRGYTLGKKSESVVAAATSAATKTRKASVPRFAKPTASSASAAAAAAAALVAVGSKRTRVQANAPAPAVVKKKTVASTSSAAAAANHRAGPASTSSAAANHGAAPASGTGRTKRARHNVKSSEELAYDASQAQAEAEKRARERACKRSGSSRPATVPAAPAFSRTHATRAAVAHARADTASPFKSMAERLAEFGGGGRGAKSTLRTDAPLKSRPVRKHSQAPGPPCSRAATVPKSPPMSRTAGSRRGAHKTSEAMELEAIAAAPKFRARPVSAATMRGAGDAAHRSAAAARVRRAAAAAAATSKPQPMAASTGRKRAAEHAAEDATDCKRSALECGEAGGSGEDGGCRASAPTVPKSPKFATTRRAALKAPPPPQAAAAIDGASRPGTWEGRATAPAPFNLTTERRGAYAQRVLAQQLADKDAADTARRTTRARPLPASLDNPPQLPAPTGAGRELTQPVPFALRGEVLHEHELRRGAARRGEEEEAAAAATRFHARPLPITHFNPMFEIEPSAAALTVTTAGATHGARRAGERARFDEAVAGKAAEETAACAEAAAAAARGEERLRRQFRASTVFTAAPVPDYDAWALKGVGAVKPSPALTNPQSPAFATTRRTRSSALR